MTSADQLTIRRPDDWHFHGRSGELLRVTLANLWPFRRALFMPNLDPPVTLVRHWQAYWRKIQQVATELGVNVAPQGTLYLTTKITTAEIWAAKRAGVVAVKAYPRNQTTNAGHGLKADDYTRLWPVFEAMAEAGLVLCLHGEHPDTADEQLREADFVPILLNLAMAHPALKIVVEHVSTQVMANVVRELPNVAATVTAHHLVLTRGDVYEPFQPHHKCMPIAKSARDREALIELVTSGHRRFFFGSDSAAHPAANKTDNPASCAAGVYLPGSVAMAVLAEVFESAGAMDRLEDFTSRFGAEWYGQPPAEDTITLVRRPWQVPECYGEVVPLKAGQALAWQVQKEAA